MPHMPDPVLPLARAAQRVTVLTGAGMSAESGVPTFRDAQHGLWAQYDASELATPQAWDDDAALVNAWYLWRVALVRRAEPHDGHLALAAWARRPGTELRIVTQNVDDLHERAGSDRPVHLHGSLFAWRCDRCRRPAPTPLGQTGPEGQPLGRIAPTGCPLCPDGRIRPGVVWFGEPLPQGDFDNAVILCQDTDLLLVVGTSGFVYPAAALPHLAGAAGVPVVEIDPNPTALGDGADHAWRSTAARALPVLLAALDGD